MLHLLQMNWKLLWDPNCWKIMYTKMQSRVRDFPPRVVILIRYRDSQKREYALFHGVYLMGPMWHIVWNNIKLCITRYMIKVSTTGTLPHIWKLKRQHHIIIVWQIYALTRDFKRKKWGGILNNCHFPTIFSVLLPSYTYKRITFQEEY